MLHHEEDADALKEAQSLLEAQKDQYGDPIPVHQPLRINYTISRKPQIDRDLRIDFEFIAEKAIPVLRIGMTTSDGLELDSSDVLERYLDVKPRQTFTKTVMVIPRSENEFYLNLFVVTEIGEEKLAKHIKIPIALGEYALKKPTPQ
ncbi:MAG: hypothetical protein GC149_10115 [Gammaproteobacteria bacterium]|nr:hypothetical protein [Gammaproteobacteria bacterium]